MGKKKMIPFMDKNLPQEPQKAQVEILRLRKSLDDHEWTNRKTNESIKILYRELEKKNSKLKEMDQLKSDFISSVSHELRTPMAIIREGVSQVYDGLHGSVTKKQKKFLTFSLGSIDRLGRIIDNLLDISKLEAGKMVLYRERFDLVGLVREVLAAFVDQANKKGIEIKGCFDQKNIEIYADKDKITQVFTNLISNSLKFTDQGFIEIKVVDQKTAVECCVKDTGKGISGEDLPKVFSKFEQFGRTPSAGEKGTGLGLAIAKAIVDLHRGHIQIQSEIHQGTQFIFTLPKLSEEDVLEQSVEEQIDTARKEQQDFSLLLMKLNRQDKEAQGDDPKEAKEIFVRLLGVLNKKMRENELIPIKSKREIFVLADIDRKAVFCVGQRLEKYVREFLLEIEGSWMGFSYGVATYPEDAADVKSLLKKAEENRIERQNQKLKKAILIVDDEPAVVRLIKHQLSAFGYANLQEAFDGEEALRKIASLNPSLLILEMKLPCMSGYEVIGQLQENKKTKNISILITSNDGDQNNDPDRSRDGKAIPTIRKPVDIDQLRRWVDCLL